MRISMFIGQLVGGGAEKVLTMLANHFVEKGDNVEIVMLLGKGVEREHFGLQKDIVIRDLSQTGSYFLNLLPWLIRIRAYLKEYRPDIIISFVGRINALVLSAAYGLRIPVVVSERSDPRHDGRGLIMLKYCDWIYRSAYAVVFQTSYQRSCFSGKHSRHSYIIPNPINFISLPNDDIDDALVITTGRLHAEKNHFMLIKAMQLVKRVIPQAKCEIYGDGVMKEKLQDEINSIGLHASVVLAGKKSNITNYVAKCGVFVMTSDYEGLSNSLMEAMMLGKVCISTDYPGVEDLITHGVNGYIVPRGNVEKLADTIVNVIKNEKGKNREIAEAARVKMKGYNQMSILSKWDGVIYNCN